VRAVNTVLMVCAMAFGIVIAMRLLAMEDVVIDKKFSELSMVPHDPYYIYAIAAAISAMGFSMIFNIQRRLLWVVAVGGIIAVCTRNFVNFELGLGPVIGSFTGAMVVSLVAVKAVHWFHVPNHVLTIPSVIPMIPGVLMYRALVALINMHGVVGEVTVAVSNGINASLIILCIALGVAVPNIFARRYIAKDLFPAEKAAKLSAKNLELIEEIADRTTFIKEHVDAMIEARKVANKIESERDKAIAYHDNIVPMMEEIRYHIDKLELIVDNQMWTLPKYRELLFIR
jgi:uncharacterized membrane protein YjjB (DUF3815 family)